MFYGIPHKERDVCSVMQETGRGFFFSKYGLRPTTLRGKNIDIASSCNQNEMSF